MSNKPQASSNNLLVILAFAAIYIIWGSTYLLNKIAVLELPPFMLSGFATKRAGERARKQDNLFFGIDEVNT